MNRVVYIGGFGNGRSSAERVAGELAHYHDDVTAFTFSEAAGDPDTVRRAVRGVPVVTHSAGLLPIVGSSPQRIEAIGAPLPTTIRRLLGATGVKTVRMHMPGIGITSAADALAVVRYDTSSLAEFAAHPFKNFGQLGEIARFDAVAAGVAASQSEIPVLLAYNDGDEYFRLPPDRAAFARSMGVEVLEIPGIHDEIVIRPRQTLANLSQGRRH